MTEDEFRQWENLPHHIVNTYFPWAFTRRPGGIDYRRFRRHLDYDDLVSEATLGLLDAWDQFDDDHPSKASFMTYAFRAIYRRVARFIDQNVSPVTTRGWQKALNSQNGDISHDIAVALACRLFSEQTPADVEGRREAGPQIEDANLPNVPDNMEEREFHQHCMRRLRRHLTEKEIRVLLERFSGKTYTQIGAKRRYTRENARRVVQELMVKAATALFREVRDNA